MRVQKRYSPFVLFSQLVLLAALWAGLVRLGWTLPTFPSLALAHGPLMVSGFLAPLVGRHEQELGIAVNETGDQPGQASSGCRACTGTAECVRKTCVPGVGTTSFHAKLQEIAADDEENLRTRIVALTSEYGVPLHIRSDNGSEFPVKRVRAWLSRLDVKPLFIEPGIPWENGYIESFKGKMRDELLARDILHSLKEAQVLIGIWRKQYNTVRPHSALGYRPPAPVAICVQVMSVGLTL